MTPPDRSEGPDLGPLRNQCLISVACTRDDANTCTDGEVLEEPGLEDAGRRLRKYAALVLQSTPVRAARVIVVT